jgi:uncharacterized membrane protein YfcA
MTISTEAALALVFFLAAIVNGVAGLGFGLVASAFTAVIVDPRLAVLLLGLVTPVTNVQQMLLHRRYAGVVRQLVALLSGATLGVVLGATLLATLPIPVLSLFFGGFTLWYVMTEFRRDAIAVPRRPSAAVAVAVGAVAGVTNGVIGASGPVLGSYLSALGLLPRQFIFGLASAFFAMSVLRIAFLIALGQYTTPTLLLSAALIVPALLGQATGFFLQRRLATETFRRVVLAVLAVAGVALLIRGIGGALHAMHVP